MNKDTKERIRINREWRKNMQKRGARAAYLTYWRGRDARDLQRLIDYRAMGNAKSSDYERFTR